MGILDEDVARVRDQTDLVALVGDHLPLRRVGQRYVGLCPFHQEKTGSFNVNPALGFYHCFGCNKSGDAITFVREIEGLDFVDAVEELAKRAGVTLRYDDRAQAKDRSRRDRLVAAVSAAIEFYQRLLLEDDQGKLGRQYLRSRGFDGDAARQFALGWSPDDWDQLAHWLQQERKLARDDIIGAGLAFVNKANRLQDQFRARLMFPIYDAKGDAVGFGGRALGEDGPKYKNSPETPIYQKSRLLYGLNWAKAEVVAKGDVIICEGYTDVMAFALAGAPNAVATCGTALADDHVRALKSLARRVTLAYDADAAGQGAAEQWYRWETEFEIQVRVADLPAGRDPADLWLDDPTLLLAALEKAEPFLQFRVDRALASADTESIEGRGKAAEAVAAIIAAHPSELVRDQYVMQLNERLGIAVDRLRDEVARAQRTPSSATNRGREPDRDEQPPSGGVSARPLAPREADLLRWAIHEPSLVADWLRPELFLDPVGREAFDLLFDRHDFRDALDASEGAVRALLERLAVEEPLDDGEPETLPARLLVRAVEQPAKRVLARLVNEDSDAASVLKHELDALAHEREIGDWESAQRTAAHLLGWVADGGVERAGEPEPKRIETELPGSERVEQEA